jgi:hypothetical protein
VIYAAIIVMWALYFIPRWLRRHEELSESRSVEKFDHAMRILSRRDPTPDQRYIVMPPKPEPVAPAAPATSAARSAPRRVVSSSNLEPAGPDRHEHESAVRGSGQRRSSRAPSSRGSSQGRSSMAIRRRRVLAALVLLTILVAAATPFTPLPWWVPLLGVLAVLVDLAHLRLQARRRHELTRTRHAVRKRLRSRLHRVNSTERLAEARRLLAERRVAAEAERVAADLAAGVAARRVADSSAGWQPTPVPLPTYVTKPVAPRVGRPIDLTHPGAWTDAQSASAGATPPAGAPDEEIFDQASDPARTVPAGSPATNAPSYDDYAAELDEILERRRAVND